MNTQIITDKIKEDKVLNNIVSFFDNDIYLVGGGVRDILSGKDLIDRDLIVTGADAGEFSKQIAQFLGGTFVPLDEVNKIYRVVLEDKVNYLDITNPVEGSLEKDILRRDLTINSVCVNIKTEEIVDITGGLKDFESKVIRGVNNNNFIDDPLRILRVFRFYSVLGFEIESDLLSFIKTHTDLILNPAVERIEYELMKLFSGKYASDALLKMDECLLLDKIFPFVNELKQVPPNAHHHLDLFHHSIETIKQLQILYDNSDDFVKTHLEKVDFGGFCRLAHLKLACFMHDIGKFSTWTIEENTGRHRFCKHDDVGSKMCPQILKKLAFSNKQINYIKDIIKNHMYATMVVSAPEAGEKSMMRYIRKMEDSAIDGIMIAKADRLSALGPEILEQMVSDNLKRLDGLLEFYKNCLETLKPLPKLLDGNQVMDLLGLTPSPKLGHILSLLHEAQLNGDVSTYEEAVDFVKKCK